MILNGERIKRRREELGYSQTDLARMIGVSPPAVSQFESGTRFPSSSVLVRLADALKVTMEYLLGKKVDLDIEDMLKDLRLGMVVRDYMSLGKEDKKVVNRVIKSLKTEKEKKE